MKKNIIIGSLIFTLSSCATFKSRRLSVEEMQRYQLSGILHEARICPTVFDEKTKSSVVSGDCEIISCDYVNGETICRAKPAILSE